MYAKVDSIMNIRQTLIKHYGANVCEIIQNCDNLDASKRFKMQANNSFDTAIKDTEIWFNFHAHKYKILFKLSLHTSI